MRFRPIALTAAAVMVGGGVMVLDPIFQGLAVALITGALASTVLTLIVVPGIYFLMRKGKAGDDTPPDTPVSQPTAHPSPTA